MAGFQGDRTICGGTGASDHLQSRVVAGQWEDLRRSGAWIPESECSLSQGDSDRGTGTDPPGFHRLRRFWVIHCIKRNVRYLPKIHKCTQ